MRYVLLLVLLLWGCISPNPRDLSTAEPEPPFHYPSPEPASRYEPPAAPPRSEPPPSRPPDEPVIPVYPEVWSQHSPAGESWEFKVNCYGDYSKLEECFLWELDAVLVTAPNGSRYSLNRDFNINTYSGEVTRRWVLYGPASASLPESGSYLFEYFQNGSAIHRQIVEYKTAKISYPASVQWQRRGNDLHVTWVPPAGVNETMNYKIIAWNEYGTASTFVSKAFPWDATSGLLENVPFMEGGNYSLNVAIFFRGGYAYSEYIPVRWE